MDPASPGLAREQPFSAGEAATNRGSSAAPTIRTDTQSAPRPVGPLAVP